MKLKNAHGIQAMLLLAFLLLFCSNSALADAKYVLDWKYSLKNLSAEIERIWLIENDSTIFAQIYKDNDIFLNVNTRKIDRTIQNPNVNGFTKEVSHSGKYIYGFSIEVSKIDSKTLEVLDTYPYINVQGACACNDLFVTRDEKMFLTGYYGNGRLQYYDFEKKQYIKTIETNFIHSVKSVNQVYMTGDGSKLIYIQEYRETNPDKIVRELRITDTTGTKEFLLVPSEKFTVSDDETLLAYYNTVKSQVVLMDLKNLVTLDTINNLKKFIQFNFTFSKNNQLLSLGDQYGSSIINLINKNNIEYLNGTHVSAIFSEDNNYFYFGNGWNIYRMVKDTTSNVETDLQRIELRLNPNPTNYNLQLTYINPKETNVKIDLVNLTGQAISQLFQGNEQQGRIEHNFNLSYITAGNYSIRIQMNNSVYFKNFIKE